MEPADGRPDTSQTSRLVELGGHDPGLFARMYAAFSQLASTTTVDDVLKWLVRWAKVFGHADRATFVPESASGEIVWSGHGDGRGAAVLEREIELDNGPHGTLRVATMRPRCSEEDEAAIELLCVHAECTLERVLLEKESQLVRRVRTLVNGRETAADVTVRQVGDVRIDLARQEVLVADTPVHLTPSEFRLLQLVTEEPERAYTRDEMLARLWGTEVGTSRVPDVHVTRLRRKLRHDPHGPKYLQAVRGVGYRFVPAADRSASEAAEEVEAGA